MVLDSFITKKLVRRKKRISQFLFSSNKVVQSCPKQSKVVFIKKRGPKSSKQFSSIKIGFHLKKGFSSKSKVVQLCPKWSKVVQSGSHQQILVFIIKKVVSITLFLFSSILNVFIIKKVVFISKKVVKSCLLVFITFVHHSRLQR